MSRKVTRQIIEKHLFCEGHLSSTIQIFDRDIFAHTVDIAYHAAQVSPKLAIVDLLITGEPIFARGFRLSLERVFSVLQDAFDRSIDRDPIVHGYACDADNLYTLRPACRKGFITTLHEPIVMTEARLQFFV